MNKGNNEAKPMVVKGPNGEFDVSSDEGRAQLEGYLKALSVTTGKLAHQLDTVKKQTKQYNLSSGPADFEEAKKKAVELRDNGASDEQIDSFWVNFTGQVAKQASKGNEFDLLWTEYKYNRPDLFANMSELDQQVYKDYVQNKHLNSLSTEQDQFSFLDTLFEGKMPKKEQSEEDSDVYFSPSKAKSANPLRSQAANVAKVSDVDEDELLSSGKLPSSTAKLINEAFGFDD